LQLALVCGKDQLAALAINFNVREKCGGGPMRLRKALLASAAGVGITGAAAGIGALVLGRELWKRTRRDLRFDDQVVVITGGSRGLGFAMAQEFAARGAKIAICGRDEEVLREAEARLRSSQTEVLAVPCNIADQNQAARLIAQATERFGRIDVLVNNAGTIAVGPIESQTLADFQSAMDTMFWGMVYTTLAVLPQMMQRRRGRIVNITSIGGKVAIPHLTPYCCAKFAAVGFSEALRAELAKDHISVTTVVPGLMRTGSHANAIFKGDHRKEYSWFSLGATLPLSAMDAHKAARRIVNAAARGASEIVLTPQAALLARAHGAAPGTVTDILGIANRFMPGSGSRDPHRFTGKESETSISRSFLTALGRSAGHALNQHPERGPVGGDKDVSSRPLGPRIVGGRSGEVLAD
jgi:short-subunit dehydrogenase